MIRNVTGLLFLICLVPALMFGAIEGKKYQDPMPMHPDTSAPDTWGYTYVRSSDPGGPAFQWVDITTRGTLVAGLADDNYVGPFPMQFAFPYYWYTVSSFYVGSNGFINFSSPANFASPFLALPNTGATVPKDLLAILAGDLDFTYAATNPRCYYWSNGNDSLVVSFINVNEWRPAPSAPNYRHTFQVVLNKADSSITYQYGLRQGLFNDATNNYALSMGWQNQTGQIGLSYYYSITPPHSALPDSGFAIKIKRTVNTGLSITDAGIVGGFDAGNLGKLIRVGAADTIKAVVKNFGTAAITNAPVRYAITRAGQPSAFDTVIVPSLAAGQQVNVIFPRLFTPAVTGTYSALFNVTVAGDVGPGNNSKTAEVASASFAIGQPTRIQFENGTVSGSTSWTGGGGFGVAIDLPLSAYPVRVESVFVQVGTITAQPMTVMIIDGSSGSPGTVLATRSVTAVASSMNIIDFRSDSVRITGGRFFVGATGNMQFSYEATAPIALRTWEYTNGWAPYRSADAQDIILRASVRPYTPPGVTYNVPEILYYKFEDNPSASSATNYAIPGQGTNPALLLNMGMGPGGQFDSALVGNAGTGTSTYLETGWNMNFGQSSWTISMWINNFPGATGTSYIFGNDITTSFRCFTNGAAGAGNITLRGNGFTNVNVTSVLPGPSVVHFVYDAGTTAVRTYVNGVFQSSVAQSPLNLTAAVPFKVGSYGTAASIPVGALVDEFRVYSRALDTTEIRNTWNRTLPATVTDVKEVASELPTWFELVQNYPNPFNPSTTIQFGLPVASDVTLKIYNILGQEVMTLFDGQRGAGTFQSVWNGRNSAGNQVASGMYFYNLIAKSSDGKSTFTNIKKMLFLK